MNETEAKNWADYHEGFNQQVCFVCGSGISKSDDPWYGYSVSSKGVDWVHTSCCTKFHFWCDTASPCSGRVPSLKFLDKFWAEHHGALDIPASRPELFRVHSIFREFRGCADVSIDWIVSRREATLYLPYADLIGDYGLPNVDTKWATASLHEMFTREEAEMCARYLAANHGSPSINRAVLPIPMYTLPIKERSVEHARSGAICVAPDWTLPFEVKGYYDLPR